MLNRPIIHRLELPTSGVTHAELLTVFESLRRQVSVSVCGSPGAFAGYGRLDLLPLPERDGDHVVVTAMLIADTGKTHLVAYEAAVMANDVRPRRSVVALGTGHTVGLEPTKWGAGVRAITSSTA